jgi:hypothetical protein
MGLGSMIGKFFNSGPKTEEIVGEITQLGVDPQGDGKSAAFRIDSMPDVQFRQKPNVLSSIHKRGERVKVVYSLTTVGVATVDYIQKI